MSIVIDTPEGIAAARLITLYHGLKLEATTGMRLTRGRSCYAIVKEEFGLKGNKAKVYEAFGALLTEAGVLRP